MIFTGQKVRWKVRLSIALELAPEHERLAYHDTDKHIWGKYETSNGR